VLSAIRGRGGLVQTRPDGPAGPPAQADGVTRKTG